MKKQILTAVLLIAAAASLSAAFPLTVASPLASESMKQRIARNTVRNNLIQIGTLADTYFDQDKAKKEVSVTALKEWLPGALQITVVDAEDYEVIVVPRGWKTISITTKGGMTVTYERRD